MNIRRLKILADYLRTMPETKFDLTEWINKSKNVRTSVEAGLLDPACGTTGCAVGHACTISALCDEGLRFEVYEPVFRDHEHGSMHCGWYAVKAFFELDHDDARHLFSVTAYLWKDRHNPQIVANRIEALIARDAA